MKKLVMLTAAICAALSLMADTETVGGYTWTYRINDDAAEIYNYGSVAISPNPTGAVTIPSTLGGKQVTRIGDSAFRSCKKLTSATIPDGVTSIGYDAFRDCTGLTSVTIPDSVTYIGDFAFRGCSGLTSVTLPDSVTSIGSYAFCGCSGLTSLTIPDGVTSIGDAAFSGCSGLACMTIPDGVTSIGDAAFSGCSSLTNVTIPDSVTRIGDFAFYGCSGLADEAGLVIVRNILFDYTGDSNGVTIPDGVTSIGHEVFYGCSGLTSVTIPDGVTSIGYEAFSGCSGLTSVTIPDSVTSIGDSAFCGCSGLEEITLPFVGSCRGNTGSSDSLFGYIFGTSCFTGCTQTRQYYSSSQYYSYSTYYIPSQLKKVVVTDETVLGYGAFYNCSLLETVFLPKALEGSVPDTAFSGCPNIQVIYYSGNIDDLAWSSITFDATGGTCDMATRRIVQGDAIGALPEAKRAGYVFSGWFTAVAGGTEVTAATVTDGDMTLYAHWAVNPFTMGGAADWTQQGDGSWRSGTITHSQETWIEKTVSGKGTLSFSWKVSSESGYDKLYCYIDAVEKTNISGTKDWTAMTYEVSSDGTHTFKWSYKKDGNTNSGFDCGWIKDVVWKPAGVTVNMGAGKSVMVPGTWIAEHENLVRNNGGNVSAALQATAVNGRMSVVECYVLGLDPESTTNDFKITSLPMKADCTPDLENIVFEPPEARWNVERARPVVKGIVSLGREWQAVTEKNKAGFRFFKVEVVLP